MRVIRGKYRIMGKIGQGGMGAVYKAQHVRFKELCTIKVMASELMKLCGFSSGPVHS